VAVLASAFGGPTFVAGAAALSNGGRAEGTLTISFDAAPNSISPAGVANAFIDFTIPDYDPLILESSSGALEPDLATTWQYVGSTNTEFDMTLRPGVTFSDGSPLTAADVQASLLYEQHANGPQSALLASVSSIAVTGPLDLSIHLSSPDPLLPEELTQTFGIGDIIGPKGLADPSALTVANTSDGAGPYVFDPAASVPGDHYTYTARRGYFDPSRQHFHTIVIQVIANSQAAVNALSTGQVDVVVQGDPTTARQVIDAGDHVTAVPFVWQGLDLLDRGGVTDRPLGNIHVRQAINYAIDRPLLARDVVGNYGEPTDETVLPGTDGWSSQAARRYPYDPAKAKHLLAEAGYPHGFTLPVASIGLAGIGTMAQAIAGELANVGIKVQVDTLAESSSSLTEILDHKFPAAAVAYGSQPVYLEGQGLFLPTAFAYNAFRTESPELDSMYAQAAAASPTVRAALDQKIEQYLVDNAWFAPVAFGPVLYFSRADIGGVHVTPGSPVASPLDWFRTKA
jgi:peptide/nickel transport system substrate-binding protein